MELPYTLGSTHFRNPIYITNYHISIVKFGWVGEDSASTKLVNSKVELFDKCQNPTTYKIIHYKGGLIDVSFKVKIFSRYGVLVSLKDLEAISSLSNFLKNWLWYIPQRLNFCVLPLWFTIFFLH
jgi:hypothetical protein